MGVCFLGIAANLADKTQQVFDVLRSNDDFAVKWMYTASVGYRHVFKSLL